MNTKEKIDFAEITSTKVDVLRSFVENSAVTIGREAFEKAVFSHPQLKPYLSKNYNLSESMWFTLYNCKTSPAVAEYLCDRILTEEQKQFVLQNEKRSGCLVKFISTNPLTKKQQLLLEPKLTTVKAANAFLNAFWADNVISLQVAKKTSELSLLEWMSFYIKDRCSVADAKEILKDVTWLKEPKSGSGYVARSLAITYLLHAAPELLEDMLLTNHPAFLQILAGSRHLLSEDHQWQLAGVTSSNKDSFFTEEYAKNNRYTLFALLRNPVTKRSVVEAIAHQAKKLNAPFSLEVLAVAEQRLYYKDSFKDLALPYEDITDEDTLTYLVNRRCFSPYSIYAPSRATACRQSFDALALLNNPNLPKHLLESLCKTTSFQGLNYQELLSAIKAYNSGREYRSRGMFYYISEVIKAFKLVQASTSLVDNPLLVLPQKAEGKDIYQASTPSKIDENYNLYYSLNYHQVALSIKLAESFKESQACWELFLTFSPDFEGTVGEMISLCLSLAK